MRVLEAELLSSISPLSAVSMLDELFERAARADDDQVITKPPSKRRTADHSGHEAAATASTWKKAPSIGLVTVLHMKTLTRSRSRSRADGGGEQKAQRAQDVV